MIKAIMYALLGTLLAIGNINVFNPIFYAILGIVLLIDCTKEYE